MTAQLTLEGKDRDAPIVFDCPMCGKHFALEVHKGRVSHRPWVFHCAHEKEHGLFLVKHCRKDVGLWLEYWAFHDVELGAWLRSRLPKGVPTLPIKKEGAAP